MRELIANRPDEAGYVQLNGANTRRQFTLFDGSCDAGDDARRALWKLVSDVCSAPELEAALRDAARRRPANPLQGEQGRLAGADVSAPGALQ